MLAVVAHHAHQIELRLASLLLCHTVEQLQRGRKRGSERRGERGQMRNGRGRRQGGREGRREMQGREGEVCGTAGDRDGTVNVNTSTFLLT